MFRVNLYLISIGNEQENATYEPLTTASDSDSNIKMVHISADEIKSTCESLKLSDIWNNCRQFQVL